MGGSRGSAPSHQRGLCWRPSSSGGCSPFAEGPRAADRSQLPSGSATGSARSFQSSTASGARAEPSPGAGEPSAAVAAGLKLSLRMVCSVSRPWRPLACRNFCTAAVATSSTSSICSSSSLSSSSTPPAAAGGTEPPVGPTGWAAAQIPASPSPSFGTPTTESPPTGSGCFPACHGAPRSGLPSWPSLTGFAVLSPFGCIGANCLAVRPGTVSWGGSCRAAGSVVSATALLAGRQQQTGSPDARPPSKPQAAAPAPASVASAASASSSRGRLPPAAHPQPR
mmetsp:Transcript_41897/g.118457  ORF Transcript_41897/g.118457 Transcript_41897/m.118457 type:complete len:281 (-) Transcript_41897:360-1202(-)